MAANTGPPPDLVDATPPNGDLQDVPDIDLSGIDVPDVGVPGVDLSGIDSSGVQLPDSNLSGIDLPDSDFSDGDLSDTNQFGVDASGIDPGIEVPGVEDSLVEMPGVGMDGIGLNEDEPFPGLPTASGADSWTSQDPPMLLQPGNATYDPGWRNDDATRGGGGRHSGPVGPGSAFGVGAGGGASGGRGGTSAGDSSGGPSPSGGPTGQDPPTFGDPSGRGNTGPAPTGGSPAGGPPSSSGTSGGSAGGVPAGSSGAGGAPTDGSPSTEPAGSAPGADADRGSAAGVGIPPSPADTPDAADGSPEQIDLPDGPDDGPEVASGPERDADGPDTDTEQSTDAGDGLAGQASDGADDGMQDDPDAEGRLIGSDAYPVDEDAQKGGPTAGAGTIFAFGIPENVTSHTSGPAPESQPSVIDSALIPGEVHWITERGERADAWGEWGLPFEGFNGPDLPEVRLAPDPTAPGTWLVQVKDPNPPDREIHDPRLGTIRDGLGTVDAQMITIARIETPDGGAPAVGLLREGDRLAIVVNLPPGGTLAETAATINAHLDVYPFASRADPPAAPPGPAPANSAAPGHTDQPTSPPTPVPGHAPGQAPAPPGGGSAPATAGSPMWPSAQGAPEPELGRGTSAGAGARPPQVPSAEPVQPGSEHHEDRSATSAETTGRANPSWLGEKSHLGSDHHHRLAKEPDGIAGDPPAITYPAGVGAYTMPDNRGDLGTLVHQMVLHWLQLRLAARGVSTGSEINTTPGGSNKRDSRNPGEVDLTIFVPDGQHPGMMHAQLYELKPRNPKEYRRYQRQVRKYGRHYHGTVGGFRISRADIGVALNAADSVDRSLFDPIVISNDSLEITIHLDLARDNNGKPIPGLIVYDKGVRQKRPGEDDSVERVKSMLKTDIRQTADAQAHGIARVGIITGGSIVTAMTAAQVLNLAGGALLAGAGAGTPGSAPIVGTASAGTAAANRVRIAAAVDEGVRIAETVDTGSTRLRIATEVLEEATEVLKQMQVKR